MSERSRTVIVISSHVARGSVGNRAVTFALERLGFTVWAAPTVLMPHHPGHGPTVRIVPDPSRFAEFLELLIQDGRAGQVAAVLSGYLASPAEAEAVERLVRAVKQASPEALYLCDPVMGDAGRLYVENALAEAIRDRLVPLADIATPNHFECAWLASDPATGETDIAVLARRLDRPAVLVTSAPALMRGRIGNLLVEAGGSVLAEHPLIETGVKGTGDLLAALLLARRLEGHDLPRALELAVSSTFEIISATARAGGDELMLARFQQSIVQPHAPVQLRRMGSRP